MPTYQYACTNPECQNRFELVQSFTDPAASECPVCGSAVRKVYGAVGVVFKGSGFYRTDSRAGDKTKSAASTSSSSTDKSEKSTDSSSPKEPAPAAKFSSAPDSSSSSPSSSTGKAAASA